MIDNRVQLGLLHFVCLHLDLEGYIDLLTAAGKLTVVEKKTKDGVSDERNIKDV